MFTKRFRLAAYALCCFGLIVYFSRRILNMYIHNNSFSLHVYDTDLKNEMASACPTFYDWELERNFGQRVVSFTFYGNIRHRRSYFEGIEENAKLVATYYPGWVMRVYHNATRGTHLYWLLQNLEIKYENLHFCNVNNIKHIGNVSAIFGGLWRFIPMADPLVDVFISRDLDSRISLREVAAVQEWLDSGLTFHIMRDHPSHTARIMAGMWGTRTRNRRQLVAELLDNIVLKGSLRVDYGFDQDLLGDIVWPHTNGDGIHHDSYYCLEFQHEYWKPFPTRRMGGEFVGSIGEQTLSTDCPIACRLDPTWTRC